MLTKDIDKNSLSSYRFIDLFAGIGGFRYALESYGAKCVFSSEWDNDAQHTYKNNFGEMPHGDITKISAEDIPPHDILVAGFPCQAFSISGKRLGFADTRGTLFFDVARIAKYHQPKILILENVKNFAKHDNGKTLTTIVDVLKSLHYDVYYQVLNSSNFGVAQKRERIYIIAFHKSLEIKSFVFPTSDDEIKILDNILEPQSEKTEKITIHRNDIQLKDNNFIQKIQPQNAPIRIGQVNKGGQGERIYSPLGHSITLSAYGGGVGAKTGLYLVGKDIRRLTPRECARVSGFPETFVLPEKDTIAYKQFGNTVVINVVQSIINNILLTLNTKNNTVLF